MKSRTAFYSLLSFVLHRYGVHEYLNCTAVEVPFKGGLISLLALLPGDPDGMRLLETRLSAQRLADILNAMEVGTVHFQVGGILILACVKYAYQMAATVYWVRGVI